MAIDCIRTEWVLGMSGYVNEEWGQWQQDRYDIVTFLDVSITLSSLRNAIVLSVSLLLDFNSEIVVALR